MLGPAVSEVVAVHRGDDHVGKAELGHRLAHLLRLVEDRAPWACRCAQLQKEQARVQVSPMIMKVRASSPSTHRCRGSRLLAHRVQAVGAHDAGPCLDQPAEPGAFTRIQSGLRRTSVSGRFAFPDDGAGSAC